ncbi:MAG TPA: EamA family transporter [Pseudomonadales bacterium]
MQVLGPLLFALIAAIGNGMFAYGQRRAVGIDNSFVFITLVLVICVALCTASAPFFGPVNYGATLRQNLGWAALGGIGLFLTYIGFNVLYSQYGAGNYILYAVLSIVTTTVIVGAWLLREELNLYHWLAVVAALATVGLYSYGNSLR